MASQIEDILTGPDGGIQYFASLERTLSNGESVDPSSVKCTKKVFLCLKKKTKETLEGRRYNHFIILMKVLKTLASSQAENFKKFFIFGLTKMINVYDVLTIKEAITTGGDDNWGKAVEEYMATVEDIVNYSSGGRNHMCSLIPLLIESLNTITPSFVKTKLEVCRVLNDLLTHYPLSKRALLITKQHLYDNMFQIGQGLHQAGDFEYQQSILELFFRLTDNDHRKGLACQWFGGCGLMEQCMNIKQCEFETDSREFLNKLNTAYGSNRSVYTFACNQVIASNIRLPLPSDMKEFWIDCNTVSQSVSFCIEALDGTIDEQTGIIWDYIYINKNQVKEWGTQGSNLIRIIVSSPLTTLPNATEFEFHLVPSSLPVSLIEEGLGRTLGHTNNSKNSDDSSLCTTVHAVKQSIVSNPIRLLSNRHLDEGSSDREDDEVSPIFVDTETPTVNPHVSSQDTPTPCQSIRPHTPHTSTPKPLPPVLTSPTKVTTRFLTSKTTPSSYHSVSLLEISQGFEPLPPVSKPHPSNSVPSKPHPLTLSKPRPPNYRNAKLQSSSHTYSTLSHTPSKSSSGANKLTKDSPAVTTPKMVRTKLQFVKTPTTCISPETTGTTIGTTTGTTTRVTKTTISSTDSVVAPRLSSSLSSASISRGGVRGEEMKRNEPEKRGGKTLNNKTVSNLKDVYDFPDSPTNNSKPIAATGTGKGGKKRGKTLLLQAHSNKGKKTVTNNKTLSSSAPLNSSVLTTYPPLKASSNKTRSGRNNTNKLATTDKGSNNNNMSISLVEESQPPTLSSQPLEQEEEEEREERDTKRLKIANKENIYSKTVQAGDSTLERHRLDQEEKEEKEEREVKRLKITKNNSNTVHSVTLERHILEQDENQEEREEVLSTRDSVVRTNNNDNGDSSDYELSPSPTESDFYWKPLSRQQSILWKTSLKKSSLRKSSLPVNLSPRKPSPRKPSPRKLPPSPQKLSPRKPSPQKLSPRKLSPRQPSPPRLPLRKPSLKKPQVERCSDSGEYISDGSKRKRSSVHFNNKKLEQTIGRQQQYIVCSPTGSFGSLSSLHSSAIEPDQNVLSAFKDTCSALFCHPKSPVAVRNGLTTVRGKQTHRPQPKGIPPVKRIKIQSPLLVELRDDKEGGEGEERDSCCESLDEHFFEDITNKSLARARKLEECMTSLIEERKDQEKLYNHVKRIHQSTLKTLTDKASAQERQHSLTHKAIIGEGKKLREKLMKETRARDRRETQRTLNSLLMCYKLTV